MSGNEKDYSDYVQQMSNVSSTISVLSGFLFTAITILITWLPDPTEIVTQFTLFFLATSFYLNVYLLVWNTMLGARYCRSLPPVTKGMRLFNTGFTFGIFLVGYTITLMFLIRYLFYLALISGALWTIMNISTYFTIAKPHFEFRRKTSK